jgi:hypothetical protein
MILKCPTILQTAIISDDPQLTARLSCALSQQGSYLPVLDGPLMTMPDTKGKVLRRKNALARVNARIILLAGLQDDARNAMLDVLPSELVCVVHKNDAAKYLNDRRVRDAKPLRWGTDRIGIGLLKALNSRQLIEFADEPSPYGGVLSRTGHFVICEAGEAMSEIVAANYAYSLGAGLHIIEPIDEVESKAILEAYYSIDDPNVNPHEARQQVQARLRQFCGKIDLPMGSSITFITKELPLGSGFPDVPSTHLFQYPDLGVSVINGFAAEQKGMRGVNIAVVVDPGKVPAPEIEAVKKLLPNRSIFLCGYSGVRASVRDVTEMVELFPYDLLIFATHCGDANGYRGTYKFIDSEGIDRLLVVDIALGVAHTDDAEILNVTQFFRFHSLDGVDWTDPVAKAKLYVGAAIADFGNLLKDETFQPFEKATIPRVKGSAAMAMNDNNMLLMPQSLADNGSPIIINNACVSWHELSQRFMFGNARAYIGTLFPVSTSEAEVILTRLLDQDFGKFLPHAVWSAQRTTYGKNDNRRPYVMTGVYTQKLRSTREDVPRRIMQRMINALRYWQPKHVHANANGNENSARHHANIVRYYKREIEAFRARWFTR